MTTGPLDPLIGALDPGQALLEDGLLGGVGGQVKGTAICGPGLVGMAQLTEQFGAGRVVQVVLAKGGGQVIQLGHLPDKTPRDIDHSYSAATTAIDAGKMDKFDLIHGGNVNGDFLAYTQFVESDIPNYFTYARNFVLGDRMFSSLTGPSFPNHLYSVGAQSGGAINNPAKGNWGCDAAAGTTVQVMDSAGNISTQFPCFDFMTLTDSLQTAGHTWKYYAPGQGQPGYIWNILNAIQHVRNTQLWTANVVPETQFVNDAMNGNLPNVCWIVSGATSEHPPDSSCVGENWTVQQINAIMQGPDWNSDRKSVV